MYVKRRPKGGWVLQKLIPRRLREAFGKAHYNAYLKKAVAPTKRDADRLASQWAADCDAEIRLVEALPESERKAFIADGGLKAARARLPKLQESHRFLASMRPETLSQHVIMSPGVPPLSLGVLAIASLKCQDDANNVVAPQIAELQDRLAKVGDTPAPRRLGNTMLDAFELWKRTGKEKADDSVRSYRRTAKMFTDVHGAISVKDIKREHVRRFYTENEPLGPAAQRVHRRNVNSMLNVALSEGWIDGNPAHGLKLSNAAQIDTGDDADDDGFPFAPTQLRNILAKAETEWADDKEMLLALRVLVYSGARAGEVCQLRCDQIETIEGIPGMRIRAEHSTQSVKNKPSRRVVPLHPKIAADVLAQSENGSEWLFPSFPHHRRAHHADKLQAAFNGRFDHKHGRYLGLLRRACGITDKNLTLHSTRHSFITACRAAGVPDSTWERITGHGKKTVSERYGTVPLIVLASAMASVDPLR